jgi:hypothetical protein
MLLITFSMFSLALDITTTSVLGEHLQVRRPVIFGASMNVWSLPIIRAKAEDMVSSSHIS